LQEAFDGFTPISINDMRLLGSPAMPGPEVTVALVEKVEALRRAVPRLTLLQSQDALTLLRYCLSIPKLLYTLRTSDCHANPILSEFDNAMKTALSTILNCDMSDM
jgi:hypothetical protein